MGLKGSIQFEYVHYKGLTIKVVFGNNHGNHGTIPFDKGWIKICLLYTSDAADDMQCVDLGGRRIIKKTSYRAVRGM